jgi:tRNA threonylcarbamoyl adenosine modification protein (Sua5/YciO/YrdC/YwlC family)
MALHLRLHPVDPQPRLVNQAVAALRNGALIVYPTDSSYALGCLLDDKAAQERIRRIRKLGSEHEFTLVCRDLGDLGTYARVDDVAYRLLRSLTPGPYTFILRASREVPRRLRDVRRRTIGLRVPDHRICRALLDSLGEPLMSSTLLLPGWEFPLSDPDDIRGELDKLVDVFVDAGSCGLDPTTVIDLSGGDPVVRRHGKGPVTMLER